MDNKCDSSLSSWSSVNSLGCKKDHKDDSSSSSSSSSNEPEEDKDKKEDSDSASLSNSSSDNNSVKMCEKDISNFGGKCEKFEEWSDKWTSHVIC